MWGAAVAGFQVDMGCPTLPASECDDPNSDWYQFITAPETKNLDFMSGQPPSTGPGFWELYEQDLQRSKDDLSLNAFRMSLEWSRIFPTATDGIEGYDALKAVANAKALERYHQMFAAIRARGMTPLVTLNHYTLPTWIHDGVACHQNLSTCTKRGWLDKERTIREISKYAGFVAKEFGGEVDLWATENEPLAVALPGYLAPSSDRANPPAVLLQFDSAKAVMLALIEAHARMYDAVKASDDQDSDGDGKAADVGLVFAMAPVKGKTDSRLDTRGAENTFYLYDLVFLDAVAKGDLDQNLDKNPVHRDDLAGRMDWLGINYYTRVTVEGTADAQFPTMSPYTTFNPFTVQQWEDYPKGLYEMAMLVKDRYGIPSIITENGSAETQPGGSAPSYLARHVQWLKRARHDGADVRGYFYWTLMDNYEWNHGMNIRMGLYGVDKDDPQKTRTLREAAGVYSQIVRANDVPQPVVDAYPIE